MSYNQRLVTLWTPETSIYGWFGPIYASPVSKSLNIKTGNISLSAQIQTKNLSLAFNKISVFLKRKTAIDLGEDRLSTYHVTTKKTYGIYVRFDSFSKLIVYARGKLTEIFHWSYKKIEQPRL